MTLRKGLAARFQRGFLQPCNRGLRQRHRPVSVTPTLLPTFRALWDMGTLYLRGASEEVGTINEMKRMARDRWNAFGQPIVTIAAGRPREGGITLTLGDLEHLLIDAGRDGWLNG